MKHFKSIIDYPGQRLAAYVLATLLLSAGPAHAQSSQGLGALLDNSAGFLSQVYQTMQYAALTGGVGAVLWGLWEITFGHNKRQQTNDGMMKPMMAIIGGGLLASVIYFMGMVNTTLFGSNQIGQASSMNFSIN